MFRIYTEVLIIKVFGEIVSAYLDVCVCVCVCVCGVCGVCVCVFVCVRMWNMSTDTCMASGIRKFIVTF